MSATAALEKLGEFVDAGDLRLRHAAQFVAFAETVAPELVREHQQEWFERIEDELPNLRAALTWSIDNQPADGVRLADSLLQLWNMRGHLIEGRRWLAAALGAYNKQDHLRIRALNAASVLASIQGDWPDTRRFAEESRGLTKQLGDPSLARDSLLTLARIRIADGDLDGASALIEEAETAAAVLEICRFSGWRGSTLATSN